MPRQTDQKMRFSDVELALIKGLFAGNEDLLFAIRKVMLQFELTESEQEMLRATINEVNYALLHKIFLPTLDGDAPFFQMTDMILGITQDIKALDPEMAWPHIKAKELEIAYIDQQLKVLQNPKASQKIKLADLANLEATKTQREQVYINITARNYLLSFVDSNIAQVKFLAGLKDESVEDTKARLEKNSSK